MERTVWGVLFVLIGTDPEAGVKRALRALMNKNGSVGSGFWACHRVFPYISSREDRHPKQHGIPMGRDCLVRRKRPVSEIMTKPRGIGALVSPPWEFLTLQDDGSKGSAWIWSRLAPAKKVCIWVERTMSGLPQR